MRVWISILHSQASIDHVKYGQDGGCHDWLRRVLLLSGEAQLARYRNAGTVRTGEAAAPTPHPFD